jgi:hypothetical protein
MRDLFPSASVGTPADDFPDDDMGVSGLGVSDAFMEKAEVAASQLAFAAVQGGFITCDPVKVDKRLCARQIFEPFMTRAWRRPVTSGEVDRALRYLAIVEKEQGLAYPFVEAVKLGIQHVLLSPNFLFRFELLSDPTSTNPQPLGAYEIASRLSYFIYGSQPDEPLLEAARKNKLGTAPDIEAQVRRMLMDNKARLAESMTRDWLWGSRVDVVNPKPSPYRTFTLETRQDLKTETALFVRHFMRNDRDFRDMLDANFTYLNDRLAKHYKMSPASLGLTSDFKEVALGNPQRGGLLTQGGILAATSAPSNNLEAEIVETSVIARGVFVVDELLCSHIPAPPEDLPFAKIQEDAQKTIPPNAPRKVREAVRQMMQPCAGCHTFLDPIGFSMENFDVAGVWRGADTNGTAVDASGELKGEDGNVIGAFNGARSLGSLIKNRPGFVGCVAKAIFKEAAGRLPASDDQCRVQRLAANAAAKGYRLGDLIASMAKDKAFTHQQGEAP